MSTAHGRGAEGCKKMASNNPLSFADLRGNRQVEPAVTGRIDLQTIDPINPDLVNDLIVLSPFRSGVPLLLKRNRQLTAIRDLHDPDANGDQGVKLCEIAKRAFADPLFGASDILTCRVGHPTPSSRTLSAGMKVLGTIETVDHGAHTLRSRCQVSQGTLSVGSTQSLKLFIADDVRKFGTPADKTGTAATGDSLGILMTLRYTGDASAAVLSTPVEIATITYSDQPNDGDKFTVNGVTFEFDSNAAVDGNNIKVTIGDSADETWATFVAEVNESNSIPATTAVHVTTANTVALTSSLNGVTASRDVGTAFSIVASGDPVSLVVTLAGDQTDGSASLRIPLKSATFSTLQRLISYINAQEGYTCELVTGANKFLPSTAIDVVAAANVKSGAAAITGYMASIADWVNTRTQGQYTLTVIAAGEPDFDTAPVFLTGGSTPPVLSSDWEDALALVGDKLQLGGIILLDTDDATIFAMADEFCKEQLSLGRWFRVYAGVRPGLSEAEILQVSAVLDSTESHLCCQRVATFGEGNTIEYLDPVFVAAAMAGGAAGNRPWENPLTMKRMRFIGLHPDDDYKQEVRESLESGGVTVLKTENGSVLCAFDVTTSLDPTRRMPRITSEVAAVRLFEMNLQNALRQYRGTWSSTNYLKRVVHTFQAIASEYERQGALAAGVDEQGNPQPAWQLLGVELEAGILNINYSIWIGGEVSQISEHGIANYQRLVAVPTL